jgi:hypothetical protein
MAKSAEDRVPCSSETKRRLRACKRGGETYDEMFRKMLAQYDPDAAQRSEVRQDA